MSPLKLLVTGAGGFVGRAVVDRLAADGHEVTALVHRSASAQMVKTEGVRVVVADITDRGQVVDVVSEAGFDAVCHLAAVIRVRESFERPPHVFDVNVGGTINLLEALQECGAAGGWTRFAFASTAAIYGSADTGRPLREDRAPTPTNPYGASKLAAEQLVAAQASTRALGSVTLRCFNVAGAVNGTVIQTSAGSFPRCCLSRPATPVSGVHAADRQ